MNLDTFKCLNLKLSFWQNFNRISCEKLISQSCKAEFSKLQTNVHGIQLTIYTPYNLTDTGSLMSVSLHCHTLKIPCRICSSHFLIGVYWKFCTAAMCNRLKASVRVSGNTEMLKQSLIIWTLFFHQQVIIPPPLFFFLKYMSFQQKSSIQKYFNFIVSVLLTVMWILTLF